MNNMQTFLPYNDIIKSIQVLDWRRLGKQRIEAMQIINALEGKSKGWTNHPATLMWQSYETCLKFYANECINEWIKRGYKNTMQLYLIKDNKDIVYPFWFGDDKFHSSHRSNLLRKDPIYYGKFSWKEKDNIEYYWPVSKKNV